MTKSCAVAAAVLVLAAAAGGAWAQGTCTRANNYVNCQSNPVRTVLPTEQQYGDHPVEAITGALTLSGQALTEIPAGGFDACPYTAAFALNLYDNDITTVGARAFSTLAALTGLYLYSNAITWMAPTSLDGLTRLGELNLFNNRLGAFDYGALAPMAGLWSLWLNHQEGGDIRCGGKDDWHTDAAGIAAAVASCGGDGSPCAGCAVGCPAAADPAPAPGACSAAVTTARVLGTPGGDLELVPAPDRSVVVVGALESATVAGLEAEIAGLVARAEALNARISTLEAAVAAGP